MCEEHLSYALATSSSTRACRSPVGVYLYSSVYHRTWNLHEKTIAYMRDLHWTTDLEYSRTVRSRVFWVTSNRLIVRSRRRNKNIFRPRWVMSCKNGEWMEGETLGFFSSDNLAGECFSSVAVAYIDEPADKVIRHRGDRSSDLPRTGRWHSKCYKRFSLTGATRFTIALGGPESKRRVQCRSWRCIY